MNVLLTRRQEECEASAENYIKAGLRPISFPLSELVVLDHKKPEQDYDFLIFTSKTGVACFNHQDPKGFDKPVYSVGEKTSEALQKIGYKNIRTGAGTAHDLALLIREQQSSKSHGYYVCGQNRAFDMQKALKEKNISLECVEAYAIQPLVVNENDFCKMLSSISHCFVMIYSPNSARHFFDIVKKIGAENLIKDKILIAISKNTSLASDLTLVKDHHIAKMPSEQSMIETVLEILRSK